MAKFIDVTEAQNPNVQKYLDFLGQAEGADYNTVVGGSTFNDYSQHPNVVGLRTEEGPSTGAGRYQFTNTTWNDIAPKLGLKDFSPMSQDLAAIELIKQKGAYEDIKRGDFDAANKKLGGVWASLPSSPYSQPKRSQEFVDKHLGKSSKFVDVTQLKKPESGFVDVTKLKKPGSGFVDVTAKTPSEDSNGWLPTMEQIKHEGFAGRILTGLGIIDKSTQPEQTEPEMSFSESLSALGQGLLDHPKDMAKAFTRGIIEDPELLYPGLWEADILKLGATAAKLGKAGKVGYAATKAGVIGGGLETTAELAEGKDLNVQRILNTAGTFATLSGTIHGAAELAKGAKGTAEPKVDKELNDHLSNLESDIFGKESSDVGSGVGSHVEDEAKTIDPYSFMGSKSDTGIPIKQGPILDAENKLALDSSGKPRLAIMQRNADGSPSHIEMNMNEIFKRFEEKPWVQKLGLPDDTFKTPQQYAKFILKHEEEHVGQSFDEWKAQRPADGTISESTLRHEYETEINKRAKAKLDAEVEQEYLDNQASLDQAGDIFKDSNVDQNPIEAIKSTLRNLNVVKRAAKIWGASIEKAIPNKGIRERTTMALENQRYYDKLLTDAEKVDVLEALNRSLIKRQARTQFADDADMALNASKIKSTQFVIDRLKSLPSEEHAIAVLESIKKEFANIGEQAKREGLIDNLRNNYVTHVLNFSESALNKDQIRTLMDRLYSEPKDSRFVRDFSQHRIYQFIRDLEDKIREHGDKMGIDVSGVKVERDIARIAEIYKQSMMTAVLQRKLINYLEKTKVASSINGEEGLPLVTRDSDIAFKNGYVKYTGRGSEALKDYAVHPDIVDPLNFAFRQTDPNLFLRALGSISMLSKFLNTVGSLFHATSLFVARATSRPGSMLKEVLTGGSGTRAALHELEHDGASKSVELALKSGLQVATEDVQKSIISDIGNTADNLINTYLTKSSGKTVSHATDALENAVISKLNRFTWDYMHAAGKLHLWQDWFTKIKSRNPEMSDEQIAREVSSFVNNTLGGLDWLEVADQTKNKYLRAFAMKAYNIQGRDWAQIALFAPDWTLSTLRSFTRALPKDFKNVEFKEGVKGLFNPKNQHDLARRYVLNTAILWLTILNGFNMAFTGRPIWTNKDPTRVDLGDGTSMQMAKHSMEAAEWFRDPEKTAGNKLGFWPKALITMTTGKAYPSPSAPMIKDNTAVGRLQHSLAAALPFQISAAANAPAGEKLKRAGASFVGLPIYGQTNAQHTSPEVRLERRQKRRESRMENKRKKLEGR